MLSPRNKLRIVNLAIIVSTLLAYVPIRLSYMDSGFFLAEMEWLLILVFIKEPLAIMSTLLIIPLLGHLFLLISVLQKEPGKLLTIMGISCWFIVMCIAFFIGIISGNLFFALSHIPFFALSSYAFILVRSKKD